MFLQEQAMGPQFYKGASAVSVASQREVARWGIEATTCGIQPSKWDTEPTRNIELSRRGTESSKGDIQLSRRPIKMSRRSVELSRRCTDLSRWRIESSKWGTETSRNVELSRWDIESSRWGHDHQTPPTSKADASLLPHTSPSTQGSQQYLTLSCPDSSANVVFSQAPWSRLSVKPSRTSEYSSDSKGHHEQTRALSENVEESNSSDIAHPLMNWNMDLKLITQEGTMPYLAPGQTFFEPLVHNQDNPYFTAARMELELVSCGSDPLSSVPDLGQTSDTDGSASDLTSDKAGSAIDLTSDTGGSAIDLTSDTGGSIIDLTSDTGGSIIDLTSDTGGSIIDLTSDTGGSITDLTLSMRRSYVELSKPKHPEVKMEGICQHKRKIAELENPQSNTPVKKRFLQCERLSSRALACRTENTHLFAVNRVLKHPRAPERSDQSNHFQDGYGSSPG